MIALIRKYYHFFVISLICLFHGASNYTWLRFNLLPPHDDLAINLMAVSDILASSHNILRVLIKSATYIVIGFYPPLFHSVMAVFNLLFGFSEISSIMANMPFLLLLLLSQYYTGKKMGDKNIGLLSGFIVMMYPYIFDLSRLALPDFAMTAMISLSICLLFYTEEFSKLPPSALFGASCGLGMLTKQMFAFFVIGPLFYIVAYLLITKRIYGKGVAVNLLVSFSTAALIAGYWYIPKLGKLWPLYVHTAQLGYLYNGKQFCPDILSFESVFFNFYNLINNQMLPFFFALFVAALALWLASRGQWKLKIMLIVSIVVPYAVFIFIMTKHPKTTAPYLIFFSLISAAGIASIKNAATRRAIAALAVIFGLLQYFDVSFAEGVFFSRLQQAPLINVFVPRRRPVTPFRISFRPQNCPPVSDEILSLIEKESAGNPGPVIAVSYATTMRMPGKMNSIIANKKSLEYVAGLKNLPYRIISIEGPDTDTLPDFVVTIDGIEQAYPNNISDKYALMKTHVLPDNSRVYIYKMKMARRR